MTGNGHVGSPRGAGNTGGSLATRGIPSRIAGVCRPRLMNGSTLSRLSARSLGALRVVCRPTVTVRIAEFRSIRYPTLHDPNTGLEGLNTADLCVVDVCHAGVVAGQIEACVRDPLFDSPAAGRVYGKPLSLMAGRPPCARLLQGSPLSV